MYNIAVFVAFIVTIILAILVLPQKREEHLSGFFKTLHNYFNFKSLWIEKILKVLFIFATCLSISVGLIMGVYLLINAIDSGYDDYYYIALGVILGGSVLGPIIIRLIYEGLMMTVLLVTNVIEINKKLSKSVPSEAFHHDETVPPYTTTAPEATPIDINAPLFNPNATSGGTGNLGLRSTFKTDNNN